MGESNCRPHNFGIPTIRQVWNTTCGYDRRNTYTRTWAGPCTQSRMSDAHLEPLDLWNNHRWGSIAFTQANTKCRVRTRQELRLRTRDVTPDLEDSTALLKRDIPSTLGLSLPRDHHLPTVSVCTGLMDATAVRRAERCSTPVRAHDRTRTDVVCVALCSILSLSTPAVSYFCTRDLTDSTWRHTRGARTRRLFSSSSAYCLPHVPGFARVIASASNSIHGYTLLFQNGDLYCYDFGRLGKFVWSPDYWKSTRKRCQHQEVILLFFNMSPFLRES